jgi:hypothetical protein
VLAGLLTLSDDRRVDSLFTLSEEDLVTVLFDLLAELLDLLSDLLTELSDRDVVALLVLTDLLEFLKLFASDDLLYSSGCFFANICSPFLLSSGREYVVLYTPVEILWLTCGEYDLLP